MILQHKTVHIKNRAIGPGHPTFIIAEIGINHGGDIELAKRHIDAAADAGADAVKFQTIDAQASYVPDTASYEEFANVGLSLNQYKELMAYCGERNVLMISTPGDFPSLKLCEQVGMPAIKISSGLMTNTPLILQAAQLGVPMIISTGMAHFWEVARVIHELEQVGMSELILLHCVSVYPAPEETLLLRAIEAMQSCFSYPVGYSDHSLGNLACVCAVALGAYVIEKHITVDRNLPRADHHLSSEPEEFAKLISEIRSCEKMLLNRGKQPQPSEIDARRRYHRHLIATTNIMEGEALSEQNVGLMRSNEPSGFPASYYNEILGKRTTRALSKHDSIGWNAITHD